MKCQKFKVQLKWVSRVSNNPEIRLRKRLPNSQSTLENVVCLHLHKSTFRTN